MPPLRFDRIRTLALFSCIACLSVTVASQSLTQFYDCSQFPTNSYYQMDTKVGDFNGDGKLDVLTIGQGIDVLLGNADGTLQAPIQSVFTRGPISVSVADFNGDGKLDLAVADFLNTISIVLGNGDGTFQRSFDYTVGKKPDSVAVADYNGDGKLDLAVSDGLAVNVLFGNGDGTFQVAVPISAGAAPSHVVSADVNSDGKADLIVGENTKTSSQVGVLLGNGNGTFQLPTSYDTGSAVNGIAVVDLNGDSKPDVVVADTGVSVLLGNGDGTFQAHHDYATPNPTTHIVVGDFNNDQKIDVAATSSYETDLLLGNGDGTLQSNVQYGAGPYASALAVGKFDANSTDDLAVLTYSAFFPNSVSILLGNRDGTLHSRKVFAGGGDSFYQSVQRVALGDFNGDGKVDVVGTNYESYPLGQIQLTLGNGDGTFQPPLIYGTDKNPLDLVVGDLNGDGKLDVVTENGPTVTVLLGNGDGTFQAGVSYPALSVYNAALALGDLNGDGRPDVVVSDNQDLAFVVLLNNGDGTLQAPVKVPTAQFPGPIVIADLNGDGKNDVVVGNNTQSSSVSVFLGKGDGTFQKRVDYPTGQYPVRMVVTDLNGDGKLDVAIANYVASVSILLGNGDGTLQPHVDFPAGGGGYNSGPSSIAVADVNGDGKMDLAVSETGDVAGEFVDILQGNGDGTFLPLVRYEASYHPGDVVATDLNGDGAPDLVIPAVWLNVLTNAGGTRLSLASSNNPSHAGEAVTFTLTAKASVNGVGTPYGKVQFSDGNKLLGTAQMQSGVASFTTSSLAVGSHSIRALYLGNKQFNRHKSDVLVQVVQP